MLVFFFIIKLGEKMDLRILKTKRNLYDALLHLMGERPFEEIKVSEICGKALINRSTFYAHFEDKYALLNSLIMDLKEELKIELLKNEEITNSKEFYMECIKKLLSHIEDRQDIYFPLIIHNRNSVVMDMIYDTLFEDVSNRLKEEELHDFSIELVSHFYLGAILHVVINWLENHCTIEKDKVLLYFNALIPNKIHVRGVS